MKYILILSLLISIPSFAIDDVSSGQSITASKMNEVINKSNSIEMGTYIPVSNFGTGIPAGSSKSIFKANYIKIGNKVKVSGVVFMKNDGASVSITWDLPILGGSDIANVSGLMISSPNWGTRKDLSASRGGTDYINFAGSSLAVSSDDHYWIYEFQYEIVP